jgi:hypothetical protein
MMERLAGTQRELGDGNWDRPKMTIDSVVLSDEEAR